MNRALLLLPLLACADTPAAPSEASPGARLVDAITHVNTAAREAHQAGYQVLVTVTTTDSTAPRLGVVLLPR